MGCPVCTASSQVGAPDCQQVLLAGAIGRGTCSHQKVAPTAPRGSGMEVRPATARVRVQRGRPAPDAGGLGFAARGSLHLR
ncbi:hypothetical protein VFPFJ_03243 [Purpureocillium lilacinum]|uniref:Uncharacterized protein n=1 Tax=Purpureocillium lilacinum TaxID=33203 RepID=A0A179HQ82_PURLI|nr:hypothetical protein VFPFJ_03243 [Purpureocillium lilacinum]OAQ91503.1 hypothetical protein VFPFJ_03243 [Purpureocillium lilacinum]